MLPALPPVPQEVQPPLPPLRLSDQPPLPAQAPMLPSQKAASWGSASAPAQPSPTHQAQQAAAAARAAPGMAAKDRSLSAAQRLPMPVAQASRESSRHSAAAGSAVAEGAPLPTQQPHGTALQPPLGPMAPAAAPPVAPGALAVSSFDDFAPIPIAYVPGELSARAQGPPAAPPPVATAALATAALAKASTHHGLTGSAATPAGSHQDGPPSQQQAALGPTALGEPLGWSGTLDCIGMASAEMEGRWWVLAGAASVAQQAQQAELAAVLPAGCRCAAAALICVCGGPNATMFIFVFALLHHCHGNCVGNLFRRAKQQGKAHVDCPNSAPGHDIDLQSACSTGVLCV